MSIDAIILTDRQTDRQNKPVFLPYFFTYRNFKVKTAGGGASRRAFMPSRDSRPPAVFLCVSYERCEVRVFYRYG